MRLHIDPASNIETPSDNIGIYDVHLTNRIDTIEVKKQLILVNDNNSALAHLRLHFQPSDGLSLLYSLEGSDVAPQPVASDEELPPLKSKQELTLFVTLDLLHLPSGPFHPTITVTLPDVDSPIAALQITGTLLPVVTFSPAALNFEHVPAGQTKMVPLTISIDPRLTPEGAAPRLFCTNPSVLIQPVPLDAAYVRKSSLLNKKQKAAGLFSYLLTLSSDASMGPVSGNLVVASIAPPPPGLEPPPASVSLDPSIVMEALHTASAEVTGRVEGDLSAAPDQVVFGGVRQGKEAVQSVWLTPRIAKALEGVQFNCPVSWLSARLIAPLGAEGSQGGGLPRRGAKDAKQGKTSKGKKGKGIASLPQSKPADQQAVGKSAPTGKAATFVTFAPFRGQLLDRRWTLEVILSPKAPVGRLQTEMILTLANGQRLVLPIAAQVVKQVIEK